MGLILEDIINRHGFYIATNTDFTYQQSTMVEPIYGSESVH